MTKHFAEECGSCFIGEKIYTLKELAEMEKPEAPIPPPMRALKGYTWVNEWELVDWYTNMVLPYRHPQKRLNWFEKLLKKDWQIKLEESLERNKALCGEA